MEFVKFWRGSWRKKLKKLEERFIDQSNILDDVLLDLSERIHLYSEDRLLRDRKLFCGEYIEIKTLDSEYKSYSNESHPNCEKINARLVLMINMINKELSRRYSES